MQKLKPVTYKGYKIEFEKNKNHLFPVSVYIRSIMGEYESYDSPISLEKTKEDGLKRAKKQIDKKIKFKKWLKKTRGK